MGDGTSISAEALGVAVPIDKKQASPAVETPSKRSDVTPPAKESTSDAELVNKLIQDRNELISLLRKEGGRLGSEQQAYLNLFFASLIDSRRPMPTALEALRMAARYKDIRESINFQAIPDKAQIIMHPLNSEDYLALTRNLLESSHNPQNFDNFTTLGVPLTQTEIDYLLGKIKGEDVERAMSNGLIKINTRSVFGKLMKDIVVRFYDLKKEIIPLDNNPEQNQWDPQFSEHGNSPQDQQDNFAKKCLEEIERLPEGRILALSWNGFAEEQPNSAYDQLSEKLPGKVFKIELPVQRVSVSRVAGVSK